MDRFTGRNDAGDLLLCGNVVYSNDQDVYNAVSRLEEYEDTGFSPDQLKAPMAGELLFKKAAIDRALPLLKSAQNGNAAVKEAYKILHTEELRDKTWIK